MNLENRRSKWTKRVDRYAGVPLLLFLALFGFPWRLLRRRRGSGPRRILVSKISALGDAVLMLPALYSLRKSFPEAQIIFLGGGSLETFAKMIPAVSEFRRFSVKEILNLSLTPFDLHLDYDQWIRATAVMAALSRSRWTCGFQSPAQGRHFAYDSTARLDLKTHMAENFWNLTAAAIKAMGKTPEGSFVEDKEECRRRWVPELLSDPAGDHAPFVVIHPGCGEHGLFREWPLESWGELVKKCLEREPGVKIFVTGHGSHEEELGRKLEEFGAISLVGKLPFPGLLGLLSRAGRIYSSNTGIMHLASFFNPSLVALHGPTDSGLWGPLWGGKTISSPLACAPCLTWGYDYGCSDPVCLKAIRVEQVIKASHA